MENLTLKSKYDVIIVGSGPAGLGAAFKIAQNSNKSVLLIEKKKISSGGLRNDCKQNYTYIRSIQIKFNQTKPCEFIIRHYIR